MMFKNRLKKNFINRFSWIKQNNIEAYRIYEKDMPEFPYIIDIYKDYALIFEKGIKDIDETIQKDNHKIIIESICEVLEIKESNIIFKTRTQKKGLSQYEKLNNNENFFTINENGVKYLVNLYNYIDSGIFLDHRPLRKKLSKISNNLNLLNLFCYTGTMSTACAKNGARTFNVDLSKTYLNWAQKNFKLNQIDSNNHVFLNDDIANYLINFNQKHRNYFDIIFCDPPTFSNSKKMRDIFDVQVNHVELIQKSMTLLQPKGTLFFSTNLRNFQIGAELSNSFFVKNISKETIPLDFRDHKIHHCFEITHK